MIAFGPSGPRLGIATLAFAALRLAALPLAALPLAVVGCSSDAPNVEDGRTVYETRIRGGNTFTCATCHALAEPAPDGFRRPGHPIGEATRRPSYKNGAITDLREAVNTCVTHWMNAPELAAGDARWVALEAFLDSQATLDAAPAIDIEIVPPPADLSGGDEASGRDFFNHACAICHGQDAVGTERAPALAGFSELDLDYIGRRVRTSGPETTGIYDGLTGGRMPFWSADRISDEELRDVAAFVNMVSLAGVPDGGMPPTDGGVVADGGGTDAGTRTCGATHPSVGMVATFETHFHNVMGTATIVDDCTIRLDGFSYDGSGIDVRLYGGIDGDFTGGFGMGDNLLQSGGYSDDTLTFTLPPEHTLDDLNGVSIWCVAVGVSFGDGQFR